MVATDSDGTTGAAGARDWSDHDGTVPTSLDVIGLATDDIERMVETAGQLMAVYDSLREPDRHWTFNPPEEPRARPVSRRPPRRRRTTRPQSRPVSPRRNRARSRVGGKTAARRAT